MITVKKANLTQAPKSTLTPERITQMEERTFHNLDDVISTVQMLLNALEAFEQGKPEAKWLNVLNSHRSKSGGVNLFDLFHTTDVICCPACETWSRFMEDQTGEGDYLCLECIKKQSQSL